MTEARNLFGRAAYLFPFSITAGAVAPTDDFRQPIAAADAMDETEGVSDIALAAGIRADDHREWSKTQRLVGKTLEVSETN